MNAHQIKIFSSKKSDIWQTPPELYNQLDDEFKFDFDPCPLNPTFDGLDIDWKKINYVNPPYSQVEAWLKKAWGEIKKGNAEVCVFLTFANTDTKWFHKYIYQKAEVRFIKGRLKFLDADGKTRSSAMRPSIIAIIRKQGGVIL